MYTRYQRLFLAAVVLFVLFFVDVWINTNANFDVGLLTGIGFVVAYHVLIIEAVISKSKSLAFAAWILVAMSSGLSFIFLDNPLDSFVVVIFLVVYTALLMRHVENIARQ